jgi:hypothetical protein
MAKRGGISSGLGLGAVAVGGTINSCPSSDTSLFCQTSRVFQVISWIFSVFIFLVVIYYFASIFLASKGKGGKWFR